MQRYGLLCTHMRYTTVKCSWYVMNCVTMATHPLTPQLCLLQVQRETKVKEIENLIREADRIR